MKVTTFIELEIEIDYDYQPAEKTTRHYPGCPEAIEINDIRLLNCEISPELFDSIINMNGDSLEEACWDDIKENKEAQEIAKLEDKNDREPRTIRDGSGGQAA